MGNPVVEEILQRIEQLSEDDRLLLEQSLADRSEREWQREAEQARQIARQQGVDESTIDEAIRELRYGS